MSMKPLAEGVFRFDEIHPPLTAAQASLEAERCLQCGGPLEPAPCVRACPAVVDVPRFVAEIRDGKTLEAAQTIFAANALGGSCARVCPAEELCEGACVLKKEGRRPIQIALLQRFATDEALDSLDSRHRTKPTDKLSRNVAVIGAGPAGLACAEELACLGYDVTVFDRRPLPGGLITYAIAPYKQRVDPIFEEAERIATLGIRMKFAAEIGKDISIAELERTYDAIFIGVGAGPDQAAGIPGEKLNGVFDSLPLIQEIKLGKPERLSLAKKRVAIIGGGNTAIDVARELIRLGVKEARIVYRRDRASMPAYKHEIDAAEREGVKFTFMTQPVRFVGNGHVNGIDCVQMQLGQTDPSGRPRPVPIAGMDFVIECDAVVKAIGQKPLEALLESFAVETKGGRAVVDETFQSSNSKVFAGGDVITGGSTVVEAIRHGKLAARGIDAYLRKKKFTLPEQKRKVDVRVKQDGPFLKHFQGSYYVGTSAPLCKGCNLCITSCPAEILALDAKSRIVVKDVAECVFCGICEMRCPDFAIWVGKAGARDHPAEVEARRRLTL